jgi:glycosyltransferase involved in cell wall biosynthesis
VFTRPHFSFIVPAHNEEQYLGDILVHIAKLGYPTDS